MSESLERMRWLTGGSWCQAYTEMQFYELRPRQSLGRLYGCVAFYSSGRIDVLVSFKFQPSKGLPKLLDANDVPKSHTDPSFSSRLASYKRRLVS